MVRRFRDVVSVDESNPLPILARKTVGQLLASFFDKLRPFIVLLLLLTVALLPMEHGLPVDIWSWVILFLISLVMSAGWFFRHWAWSPCLLAFACLLSVELHQPLTSSYIQDIRGGRRGVRLDSLELRFGQAGYNTKLLESYLGRLEPEWRHSAIRSVRFGHWRDGNERVNSRSLIRSEELPDILKLLPHEAARKRVLRALTCPRNYMRVHQGLLLACVYALGFPKDMDSESWWERHEWIFMIESNCERAAFLTKQWSDRCAKCVPDSPGDLDQERYYLVQSQLRAAYYQEYGAWGGDRGYVAGVWNLNFRSAEERAAIEEEFVISVNAKEIVWWK